MTPVTDTPVEGFYKATLTRGGPWVPVRIWHGPPLDPDLPRFLDRAPVWQCLVKGRRADVDRFWPWCGKHPIRRAEYRYLLARHRWAVRYQPSMPEASPRRKVDLHSAPVLF